MNEINESRNSDYDDEESQEDFESRLYAEIYHTPQEKDWTPSTNEQSLNNEKIIDDNQSHQSSVNVDEISSKKHKTINKCKGVSSPNKDQPRISISVVPDSSNTANETFRVPCALNKKTFSTHSNSIEKILSKVGKSPRKNLLKEYKSSKSLINTLYKNKRRELEVKLQKESPKEIEIITIENKVDNDSRYNVVTKSHKEKLKMLDKINLTMENSSDSDESIFEVPLPPKPPPPLVNLQDSDEDSTISSGDVLETNTTELPSEDPKSLDLVVINCPDLNQTIDESEISIPSTSNSSPSKNSRKRPHESETEVTNNPKRVENSDNNKNKQLFKLKRRKTSLEKQTQESWNRYFFQPLSDDLRSFYNDPRDEEVDRFIEIRSRMRKDPKLWTISKDDLYPPSKRQRFWNIRCAHCQREGHHKNDCPESNAPECCYMCGIQGHTKSRCPLKMCLSCGKKQTSFKKTCERCEKLYCNMCKTTGHGATSCPDLWRRYHDIVNPNDVIRPEICNSMKPQHLLHCCNCTKRGHDFSMCGERKWSQHRPTPPYVSNYLDIPGQETRTSSVSQTNEIPLDTNSNSENSNQRHILYACGIDTFNSNDRFISIHPLVGSDLNTKDLLKGSVYPKFLEKLLILTSFKMILFHDTNDALYLEIVHHKNKSFVKDGIEKLILLWLSISDGEKRYFELSLLPQDKFDMIKLLKTKIRESEENIQNPKKIFCKIMSLKAKLKNIAQGSKTKNQVKQMLSKARLSLNTTLALSFKDKFNDFIKKLEDLTNDFIPGPLYFKILIFYHDIYHSCHKTCIRGLMRDYRSTFVLKNPVSCDPASNDSQIQLMPSTSGLSVPVTEDKSLNKIEETTSSPADEIVIPNTTDDVTTDSLVEDLKTSPTNESEQAIIVPPNNIQTNTDVPRLKENNKNQKIRINCYDPDYLDSLIAKEKLRTKKKQRTPLIKNIERTKRLLNSAKTAIDKALRLEIPKLTSEAKQVEQKLSKYSIKKKDIDMLNKFISFCRAPSEKAIQNVH